MKSIEQLPQPVQNMFNAVKESASKYGEDRANQIAWETVKQKFTQVGEVMVAKSEDFNMYETVSYEFKADELSLAKTEDGFTLVDYVLSGNNVDSDGQSFSDFALKRMTEQINEDGLVGRIDANEKHELRDKLIAQGLSNDEIEKILQSQETGIKAISATYINGKMTAKVKIPNDNLDNVLSYKGASIEARVPKEAYRAGVFNQARAIGFVFTNHPANPITGLVS